jgi:hypothetical protein
MQVFHILAGLVVLLFGRPLYWALVAVLGFVIGFDLVQDLAISDSKLIQFLVALGAGILAAGLAVAFQWLAFGLVGFLSGSYLVQAALVRYDIGGDNQALWILAGGVVGGVIGLMLADWAVIILSSLAGATLISDEINVDQQTRLLILLGLTVIGVAFQRTRLRREKLPG